MRPAEASKIRIDGVNILNVLLVLEKVRCKCKLCMVPPGKIGLGSKKQKKSDAVGTKRTNEQSQIKECDRASTKECRSKRSIRRDMNAGRWPRLYPLPHRELTSQKEMSYGAIRRQQLGDDHCSNIWKTN